MILPQEELCHCLLACLGCMIISESQSDEGHLMLKITVVDMYGHAKKGVS